MLDHMETVTMMTLLIAVLLALTIGAALGALLARTRALQRQFEVATRLARAETERDGAQARLRALEADHETMVNQFRVLSEETLDRQVAETEANAQARLAQTAQLLDPVQQTLHQLNDRLVQIEQQRVAATATLHEQVNTVVSTSERLRHEANGLATALRKPQVRGAWGELQLKRVVEIAGMREYCDFVQQSTSQTSDATIRPDLKVLLGDGKFVYVDAKVPLAAFLDAYQSDDAAHQEACLDQFVRNVRTHIDQLSAKRYWSAAPGSPEFVVLFIGAESLAAEALSRAPDLHEYAADRNIILASPTTLIGLLRAISYGWQQAALADSAAEVFALGRELYVRLGKLGESFEKLGRGLNSTVCAYNSTLATLEGRVLVTARRFHDLKVSRDELAPARPVETAVRALVAPELTNAHEQEIA